MAVVKTEGSLTDCNEPLEFIDAAESDGDQQLAPFVTDDAPEKTISGFLLLYLCCVFHATLRAESFGQK